MRAMLPWQLDLIPWYIFGAYWLITWLRVKHSKTTESLASRLVTIIPMVLAFELLFSDLPRIGLLRLRFTPADAWIAWLGFGVISLGVAIAIWARYCIGEYWSSRVTLKEGHRIIRTGPYQFVRHPIYTGMLMGAIGRALTIGEWRAILGVVLVLGTHWRKARREESLLTAEFGEEYAAYRRSTGFLFPRLSPAVGMDTHNARS
jgi:protein-S-isoprenylcysteine O-methyltransferase Ste14